MVADAGALLTELAQIGERPAEALDASRPARLRFLERVRSGGALIYDEEHTRSDAAPIHPAGSTARAHAGRAQRRPQPSGAT